MKILLLSLLFCAAAFAAPSPARIGSRTAISFKELAQLNYGTIQPFEAIETINEWTDVMLLELRYLLINLGLDPMKLPDLNQTISGAALDLKNGVLRNITSIQRQDEIIVDYENRIIAVDIPLEFDNFALNYDYKVKFLGLSVAGNVTGKVEKLGMFISMQMDFKELVLTLNEFKIAEIGTMNVKFQGGSIDWLMNLLTGAVTSFFKSTIGNLVGGFISDALQSLVQTVNEILAQIKATTPASVGY